MRIHRAVISDKETNLYLNYSNWFISHVEASCSRGMKMPPAEFQSWRPMMLVLSPLTWSSCTEWRRSDLLLLSPQQEAAGATREVRERERGSGGSSVGLPGAPDEEEGVEGGWGRNTMLLLLRRELWLGTFRWESDWWTKGGRWSGGGTTVTEGRVFLRRREWGDGQTGSLVTELLWVGWSSPDPAGVRLLLEISRLMVPWEELSSVRGGPDWETLW